MTEVKTTTKKTPATKKAATGGTAAAEAPVKEPTPAVKKTATASAERKTPAKKAATPAASANPEPAPAPLPTPTAAPETDSAAVAKPSAEERYRMIESAAYFIAEKDGFQGCATHYWSVAEQEIALRLGEAEA